MASQPHFYHANNAPYLWYFWMFRHPGNPPLDADLDSPLWKMVLCIMHRVKANVDPTIVQERGRERVVHHHLPHMYDDQFGMCAGPPPYGCPRPDQLLEIYRSSERHMDANWMLDTDCETFGRHPADYHVFYMESEDAPNVPSSMAGRLYWIRKRFLVVQYVGVGGACKIRLARIVRIDMTKSIYERLYGTDATGRRSWDRPNYRVEFLTPREHGHQEWVELRRIVRTWDHIQTQEKADAWLATHTDAKIREMCPTLYSMWEWRQADVGERSFEEDPTFREYVLRIVRAPRMRREDPLLPPEGLATQLAQAAAPQEPQTEGEGTEPVAQPESEIRPTNPEVIRLFLERTQNPAAVEAVVPASRAVEAPPAEPAIVAPPPAVEPVEGPVVVSDPEDLHLPPSQAVNRLRRTGSDPTFPVTLGWRVAHVIRPAEPAVESSPLAAQPAGVLVASPPPPDTPTAEVEGDAEMPTIPYSEEDAEGLRRLDALLDSHRHELEELRRTMSPEQLAEMQRNIMQQRGVAPAAVPAEPALPAVLPPAEPPTDEPWHFVEGAWVGPMPERRSRSRSPVSRPADPAATDQSSSG